ncbi:MAG: serine hydrolase domain-containing protein [Halothermotrichaceae bacterium]
MNKMKYTKKKYNMEKIFRNKYLHMFLVIAVMLMVNIYIYAESSLLQSQRIRNNNNLEFVSVEQLGTYFDKYFEEKLDEYKIPGAAVSVINKDNIVLKKGYGLADIEKNQSVNADESVFRMASLAKLFTVTAILQLVESGKINLDDNVNKYLNEIKIDDTFDSPITIRTLLTHTEGLEGHMIALKTIDGDKVVSMKEFLSKNMAARIMEPGQMITYGNYATGILGVVIENQSGQSLQEYMSDNIFKPLSMNNSSFEQPLSDNLMKKRAGEYRYDDNEGKYVRLDPSYSHLVSSGGFHSTAADISKFASTLLSDDRKILKNNSKEMMFRQQFTGHSGLPGITFGLFEIFGNGERVLVRDGDSEGFRTRLMFLSDYNIGVFLTYNTDEGAFRDEFLSDFLDKFFPDENGDKLNSINGFEDRSKGLAGSYNFVQYPHTTFAKIVSMFTAVKVSVNKNSRTISTSPSMEEPFGNLGQELEFVEIKPYLFRSKDKEIYIAFDKINDKNYLYSGSGYHGSYEKLYWYQNTTLHQSLFIVFILLFIGLLTYSFNSSLNKKIIKTDNSDLSSLGQKNNKQLVILKYINRIVIVLNVIFILALIPVIMVIGMTPGLPAFVKGINLLMIIEFTLPIIASILVVIMILLLVSNWKNKLKGRWYYLSVCIISALYYLLLNYWNLYGYQFTP